MNHINFDEYLRPEEYRSLQKNIRFKNQLFWRHVVTTIKLWHDRARQRRQLAQFTSHQLKDIGVTRVDVWQEVNKPFWKA